MLVDEHANVSAKELGRKENLQPEKPLLCTHYRLQLQAFPTAQRSGARGVPGEGKDEEKTNRDSSVQAFSTRNQSSVYLL